MEQQEIKTKICTKCKLPKVLDEFNKRNSKCGLSSACKKCNYTVVVNRRNNLTEEQIEINREKRISRDRAKGVKPRRKFNSEEEREQAKKESAEKSRLKNKETQKQYRKRFKASEKHRRTIKL